MNSPTASQARTVSELEGLLSRGVRAQYLYFWGHGPKQAGVTDVSCFSQWYSSPFELEGRRYATAEHYIMAQKALLFGDEACCDRIIAAASPGAAKALGRKVRDFDRHIWEQARFGIAVAASLGKFSQHSALRQFLLDTGDQVLVEANPVDTIWGIGLDHAAAEQVPPSEWQGLNLLGFALMEARDQLRNR